MGFWKYTYSASFEFSDGTLSSFTGQGMSENEAIARAKERARCIAGKKVVDVHHEEMKETTSSGSTKTVWQTFN